MEYKYKVSVIVPVYNPGEYLQRCLDSLIKQSINKNEIEVLLIDDGSTDGSLKICNQYADVFPFFRVFHKENTGVGDTRNYGIDRASGKFLFFLDSDDSLSPETIESVTDYFETVYDEVDLVTYTITPYQDGKPLKRHYRYQYVNKSGVYSLDSIPLFAQTTMNIVTKNDGQKFVSYLTQSEDQLFITDCILKKNRIGFCSIGEYQYTRNSQSAVGSMSHAYYMFEQQLPIFEKLFKEHPDSKYVQGLVLGNYRWMLLSDCIFPYHYEGEKKKEAEERFRKLIDKLDVDTIMSMPEMDTFHKHFWISQKRNIFPAIICGKENVSVFIDGKKIYDRIGFEIVINKASVIDSTGVIVGFIKSPVFSYTDEKPRLLGIVNSDLTIDVPVFESINSHYKTSAKTNTFWGFIFENPVSDKDVMECTFAVEFEGVKYDTFFYLNNSTGFNSKLHIESIEREGYEITSRENRIIISPLDKTKKLNPNYKLGHDSNIFMMRDSARRLRDNKRIWLYCDSINIGADNGYLQFLHDWDKDDGVDRYYVFMGDADKLKQYFTPEQEEKLIVYGTDIHKLLFLSAEYVICSFIDLKPRCPFNDSEYAFYRDMPQPKIIYVGHGVLHADLTYTMSAERCKIDRFVISTYLEQKVLVEEYHYREKEILPFGAPRYDFIDKATPSKNRILYAPSWRKYLADRYSDNNVIDLDLLKKSDYFSKIVTFLNSDELVGLLEENDLYLDVKLHPNAMSVVDELGIFNSRIVFLHEKAKVEDYKIFITDISSYVFDFAYLQRPIIYFMPDMEMFKSGMHSYRRLHMPLEEGFGNLTEEARALIKELDKLVRNEFKPEDIYLKRMKEIFIPLTNCRDMLYESLEKGD